MKPRSSFPWYLDGKAVKINRYGQFRTGIVSNSRTMAGNRVEHYVELDYPMLVNAEQRHAVLVIEQDCKEYNSELLEILE